MGSRSRRDSERGVVILVVLVSVFALSAVTLTGLVPQLARAARVTHAVQRARAYAIAEGGLDAVVELINAGVWNAASTVDWQTDGVDNDGDGLVDEGDERLFATADLWAADGIDNDGDRAVDEWDEGVARITSTARVGFATCTVTGWAIRVEALLPPPAGGVIYLNDPLANVSFQGNAFEINGTDMNIDNTPGPELPIFGVSINGNPAQVLSQLAANQLDNVIGLGGWPSVGPYFPGDPGFIGAVIQRVAPRASIVFNNYSGTLTGSLGDPVAGVYKITLSNGDLTIGSGSVGAGILLVDGNLKIVGGWTYRGYVFVNGNITVQGSANQKRVRGAIFVNGDLVNPEDLTLSGAMTVQYSSQALRRVRQAFALYRLAAMKDGV